jgi:hypothetical protein
MTEAIQPLLDAGLSTSATTLKQWKRLCGSGHLFAIVDACGEKKVPPKCREAGPARAISLYRSTSETNAGSPVSSQIVDRKGMVRARPVRPGYAEQYAGIAPYLMQLDEGLFDWIAGSLWNSPWGIFAYAQTSLPQLRLHFRRYLKVRHPDGKVYFFRFYDPRVLPSFLDSCTQAERVQFFGPVVGYGVKNGTDVSMLRLES